MVARLFGIVLLGLGSLALTGIALFMLIATNSLPTVSPDQDENGSLPAAGVCEKKHSAFVFGYSFCYPDGWLLTEFGLDKETLAIDPEEASEAPKDALILVQSLDEKSNDLLANLRSALNKAKEERIAIDGVDGTKITGDHSRDRETTILVARGRYTYAVTFRADSRAFRMYAAKFNQIMATWKWIEMTGHAPVRSASGDLVVELPTYDALVRSPLTLKGMVRSFESRFSWRLKDTTGKVLASGSATASSGDAGQLIQFSVVAKFTPPTPPESGTLEVYTVSPKDGSEENLVTIPVGF